MHTRDRFVANWGDPTQLATAAHVAMTGQRVLVAIGAVAALWLVSVLATVAGAHVARALSASVALFGSMGVFVLASASRS